MRWHKCKITAALSAKGRQQLGCIIDRWCTKLVYLHFTDFSIFDLNWRPYTVFKSPVPEVISTAQVPLNACILQWCCSEALGCPKWGVITSYIKHILLKMLLSLVRIRNGFPIALFSLPTGLWSGQVWARIGPTSGHCNPTLMVWADCTTTYLQISSRYQFTEKKTWQYL